MSNFLHRLLGGHGEREGERGREGNPLHISNFLKDLCCGKMGIGDVLGAGNFSTRYVEG